MTEDTKTVIYLVRHAAVENPNDILYGRLPRYKLSAEGRKQAARLGEHLAREELGAIYCSPRLRARETAAHIRHHHPEVPLRISKLLDEVLTSWQGSHGGVLGRNFDFYGEQWRPGDEKMADIMRRMAALVRQVVRRHRGQKVVCVSHGDPIIIARTYFAGLPLLFEHLRANDYPERASITSLTFDGTGELPEIGYVDAGTERRHLPPIPCTER